MENCLFCKIKNGEIPSYKIYEDELTYAFLDISKDALGHTLVIPKTHFENIFQIDEKHLAALILTTQKISSHYKSLGFSGVNIINNSGKSAEQSVMHLHFHIIPRKKNDGLKINPTLKEQNISLEEVQKNLFIKS